MRPPYPPCFGVITRPLCLLALLANLFSMAQAGIQIKGTVTYETRLQTLKGGFVLRIQDDAYHLTFEEPATLSGQPFHAVHAEQADGTRIPFYEVASLAGETYHVRAQDAKLRRQDAKTDRQPAAEPSGSITGVVIPGTLPSEDPTFPQARAVILAYILGPMLDPTKPSTVSILSSFQPRPPGNPTVHTQATSQFRCAFEPASENAPHARLILLHPGFTLSEKAPRELPKNVRPPEYDPSLKAYRIYEAAPFDNGYPAVQIAWSGKIPGDASQPPAEIEFLINRIAYDTALMKQGTASGILARTRHLRIETTEVTPWQGSEDELLPKLAPNAFLLDYKLTTSDGRPTLFKLETGQWLRKDSPQLKRAQSHLCGPRPLP